MTDVERIDAELASMRERIADDGVRLVALEGEIARLSVIVGLLQENSDLIATGLERHQMHHEAVEEIMDKPITRAVVERMLRDIEVIDRAKQKERREATLRIIHEVQPPNE